MLTGSKSSLDLISPRSVLASLCLQQVRKNEECCNCLGLRWPGLVWTFNRQAWTAHRRSCVADRSAVTFSLDDLLVCIGLANRGYGGLCI